MPNLRGKNWSEGDYFKPSDAQFFEDHLCDGQGGGGEWGTITGDIHNQQDLINYVDTHGGGGGNVPSGGTTGQVLTKTADGDYDMDWQDAQGGGGEWGTITGNIQSQTDLVTKFVQQETEGEIGEPNLNNADTLGGQLPDYYAKQSDLVEKLPHYKEYTVSTGTSAVDGHYYANIDVSSDVATYGEIIGMFVYYAVSNKFTSLQRIQSGTSNSIRVYSVASNNEVHVRVLFMK